MAALVAGAVLTLLGLAPVGIPLLLIGVGVLVFNARQTRRSHEPETVPGGHKDTGYAHKGQENMVP